MQPFKESFFSLLHLHRAWIEWVGSQGLFDRSTLSKCCSISCMLKKYDSVVGVLITSQSTMPRCLRLDGKRLTLIFAASTKQCFSSNDSKLGQRWQMFSKIAGLTDSWCMRFRWLRKPPMAMCDVLSFRKRSSLRKSQMDKGFEVVSTRRRHKVLSEAILASRSHVLVKAKISERDKVDFSKNYQGTFSSKICSGANPIKLFTPLDKFTNPS